MDSCAESSVNKTQQLVGIVKIRLMDTGKMKRGGAVGEHPPTESQGSEVASLLDWAAFQGSLGRGGASEEEPNISTSSNMADLRGSRRPLCQSVPNILRVVLLEGPFTFKSHENVTKYCICNLGTSEKWRKRE